MHYPLVSNTGMTRQRQGGLSGGSVRMVARGRDPIGPLTLTNQYRPSVKQTWTSAWNPLRLPWRMTMRRAFCMSAEPIKSEANWSAVPQLADMRHVITGHGVGEGDDTTLQATRGTLTRRSQTAFIDSRVPPEPSRSNGRLQEGFARARFVVRTATNFVGPAHSKAVGRCWQAQ
jgi:hypothetical protein